METITMPDLINQKPDTDIDPESVSTLFNDIPKISERMTKTVTFTLRKEIDEQWRDFLHTFTGTVPQRGRGISSPLLQVAMKLFMAIVASFKREEIAEHIRDIVPSDHVRTQISDNLKLIANLISPP